MDTVGISSTPVSTDNVYSEKGAVTETQTISTDTLHAKGKILWVSGENVSWLRVIFWAQKFEGNMTEEGLHDKKAIATTTMIMMIMMMMILIFFCGVTTRFGPTPPHCWYF